MTCGIYKITNLINNKCYIGQSVNIEQRWKRHKTLAKSNTANSEKNYPLYLAFRKYGVENFRFEIIIECESSILDSEEEKLIRQYRSDNHQYGYNCRKQFTQGKIGKQEMAGITKLLEESALSITEIASMYSVATTVISKINKGEYHRSERSYPIRSENDKKILTKILLSQKSSKQNLLDFDFRKNHSISDTLEVLLSNACYQRSSETIFNHKKQCPICGESMEIGAAMCLECYKRKRNDEIKLPEEDISLELIKRILDSSLDAVAHEYGYASGNAVKKLLQKHNMPSTKQEMYRYYEEQTGSRHPKEEMKEKKYQAAKEHKRHTHARKVGQFDLDMHLVAVFSSTKHATKITGISNSKIVNCCNGDLRQTGGYIFRYLAADDAPIAPDDLLDYEWNTSCSICGSDTESVTADFCPRCEHARQMVSSELSLEMLLELLSVYPLAQLSRLLSCEPKTLYARFARLGMSKSEVRELNRRNNERRRS